MFLLVFENSDIGASSPSRCSQETHDVISYWGHSTLPQNFRSVRDALQTSAKFGPRWGFTSFEVNKFGRFWVMAV